MSVNEVLAHPYFKEFTVPLLAVVLTTGVKVVSRRDSFLEVSRDDFAIGFDLIVTSLILLVTYSSKLAVDLASGQLNDEIKAQCTEKLGHLPWMLLFAILGLWGLSTLIRLYGWQNNNSRVLKLWPGVIIPTLLGILSLLFIVNFIFIDNR